MHAAFLKLRKEGALAASSFLAMLSEAHHLVIASFAEIDRVSITGFLIAATVLSYCPLKSSSSLSSFWSMLRSLD